MRVVFVHSTFESLGLEYLSASLRARGVQTRLVFDPRLFDDPFLRVPALARLLDHGQALPRRVADLRPDLVCFSVVAADYRWALDMARRIKSLVSAPIVFGGVHPSAAPAAVLDNPQVDHVIVGEGEGALTELASTLQSGGDPLGIPNLCTRRDGELIRTPPRPLVADLDRLPFPDKALFYREVPYLARHYTLLTRRGCAARCAYCHNSMWPTLYPGAAGQVRLRGVDNVLEELSRALARYSFTRVRINDDLFSHDPDWLVDFCRRYRHEIRRPFMCSCSPAHLTDAVVAELKAAGCFQVCVGVQSIREDVRRDVFCRFTPQEQVVSALAALRKHRLRATVDNILGYPGEGPDDAAELGRFYLDNPVYGRYTVFWLIHFAGTALTEQAVASGDLTRDQAALLERAPAEQANTLIGEAGSLAGRRRRHLLLLLLQLLPSPVGRMLLRADAHRWLPATLDPGLLEAAWTLFTRDRLDPVRRRYHGKLLHFGLARLARILRR